jgi:Cyclic phosphodiesterase-like protein
MLTRASFWLLPTATDRAFLQNLINDLAQAHESPVFEPHVTLYSGTYAPDEPLDLILAQAVDEVEPLPLRVDRISYTPQFTKTLFVQFCASPRLSRLSDRIRACSSRPSDYVLDPHLSLMYNHMSEAEQQRLAVSIQVPLDVVTFDEVCVTVTPTPTRSPQDVARWDIPWRHKLKKK